jgi:ubiquinone/menaquinone biosynthesis C-methylase UbiE
MAVLKEMLRVLKPGGLLLIAELYFPNLIRVLANAVVPLLKFGVYHFYSRSQMERLFQMAVLQESEYRRVKGFFILYTRK